MRSQKTSTQKAKGPGASQNFQLYVSVQSKIRR